MSRGAEKNETLFPISGVKDLASTQGILWDYGKEILYLLGNCFSIFGNGKEGARERRLWVPDSSSEPTEGSTIKYITSLYKQDGHGPEE